MLQVCLPGDCRRALGRYPDRHFHCVVTSPPYFGLRDYEVKGQIGLERSPGEYAEALVGAFREVRRVLRDDGVLWLNLGDSYHNLRTYKNGGQPPQGVHKRRQNGKPVDGGANRSRSFPDVKEKDMMGLPWTVALALRADGWHLRSDVIWHKPNQLCESIKDRPSKSHEYLFLLSRSERYFYDSAAWLQPLKAESLARYAYDFGGAKAEALVEADKVGPLSDLRLPWSPAADNGVICGAAAAGV